MERWRPLAGPVITGVIWCLLALATLALRTHLHAVILIWLPSGVGVAALHCHDRRQWPALLAAMFCGQMVASVLSGIAPANAVAFGVATMVEAAICARIGRKVLAGRGNVPRTFGQIAGLFMAAVAGAAASALISFPFRADTSLAELAWWFLASVLGLLVGTPIFLFTRQKLGFGNLTVRIGGVQQGLPWAVLGLVALGWLVLSTSFVPLSALLLVGIVATAIRFGQLGAAFAVLAYCVSAMALSIGGQSPVAFVDLPPFEGMLYLQAMLLVMLGTTLPLAAVLLSRELLEDKLRARAHSLRESVAVFHLAEDLAGIGRWRYDLRSGAQEWTPRMLELHGLPVSLAPDPGDLHDRLPDAGKVLFGEVAKNRDTQGAYSFTYPVRLPDGRERILRLSLLNEFDGDGERLALFGVAMDVTEQVRREQALDAARGRAVQLAAEAQKLANTDTLTGLPNRRCTLARLRQVLHDARRTDAHLSVVMFDIDHFKQVNDGYGHQTGDDVLVRVSRLAADHVRAGDLVGRLGGEEFVWLLPGLALDDAHMLADRLRGAIERGSGGGGLPVVTASIGVAALVDGDDADRLLARADGALYAAKQSGRNRVLRAA